MHESATGHRRARCTRLMRVTEIRPAADADAAQWLLRSDVDWRDLVRYGPPGFDVYVRIAFPQDSGAEPGKPSAEAPADAVRAALMTRTRCGDTADAVGQPFRAGCSAHRDARMTTPSVDIHIRRSALCDQLSHGRVWPCWRRACRLQAGGPGAWGPPAGTRPRRVRRHRALAHPMW
jgi:hypothetical protein